jgi:hypothetical protein
MPYWIAAGTRHGFGIAYHRLRTSPSNTTPIRSQIHAQQSVGGSAGRASQRTPSRPAARLASREAPPGARAHSALTHGKSPFPPFAKHIPLAPHFPRSPLRPPLTKGGKGGFFQPVTHP